MIAYWIAGFTITLALAFLGWRLVRVRMLARRFGRLSEGAERSSAWAKLDWDRIIATGEGGAIPSGRSLEGTRPDWDRIIAAGEALIAARPRLNAETEFVKLPLGVAYHQRTSRSLAQGNLTGALRDVDRAIEIDPYFFAYRTTRAIVLDALGRRAEARSQIDACLLFANAQRRR